MDYKLAKELKDSRFPKSEDWGEHSTLMKGNYFMVDGYGVPKLSELIDACGEDFSHLKRYPVDEVVYWWAVTHSKFDKNGNNSEEQGKTPEEAVARLWLALNKK